VYKQDFYNHFITLKHNNTMIKRVLYFGNAAYLKVKDNQLIIEQPNNPKPAQATIEDIGVIIFDNPQITMSHTVLTRLLENNAAIITCDDKHLPTGMMLPLEGNSLQSERFKYQIEASEPLKKQLWQQTVSAKIRNQALLLQQMGKNEKFLLRWSKEVKSGDENNIEAKAAAFYWKHLFSSTIDPFYRDRMGDAPNNLLNYGYAILRAIVARGLVSSGLLPTLGIHHHNKYNAYCLADDIMEPYRPFVDRLVCDMVHSGMPMEELDKEHKRILLGISVMDVQFEDKSSPLMVGIQSTTASLAKCYIGESRKLIFPTFC
jgi:CRISP-associated protein Cas1